MYGENFTVSDRYKKSTATFINALTENYAADNAIKKSKYEQPFSEEAGMIMESVYRRDANLNRYHSFVETHKCCPFVDFALLDCQVNFRYGADSVL